MVGGFASTSGRSAWDGGEGAEVGVLQPTGQCAPERRVGNQREIVVATFPKRRPTDVALSIDTPLTHTARNSQWVRTVRIERETQVTGYVPDKSSLCQRGVGRGSEPSTGVPRSSSEHRWTDSTRYAPSTPAILDLAQVGCRSHDGRRTPYRGWGSSIPEFDAVE